MTIRNRVKEYRLFDLVMYNSATNDIATMLSLMGVEEGELYRFRQKVFSRRNDVTDIAYYIEGESFSISLLHDNGNYASGYKYGSGELFCRIQAELRKDFRKYVRTTQSLPRKYLTRFRDLQSDYYYVQSETERAVARDIIQMCTEMGIRPGESLSLPDVKKPKNHADSICKICFQKGKAFTGGITYDFDGDEYCIGYQYYDDWGINYAEACGVETILGLYQRVTRLYRRFKKEEKEEAKQRQGTN